MLPSEATIQIYVKKIQDESSFSTLGIDLFGIDLYHNLCDINNGPRYRFTIY